MSLALEPVANIDLPVHNPLSYLKADDLGPWGQYLEQVDRVLPIWGASLAGLKPCGGPSVF